MMPATEKKPLAGWRVWGGNRCDHCCNGDRCDDRTHLSRDRCPYCLGTGKALWLAAQPSPTETPTQGAKP